MLISMALNLNNKDGKLSVNREQINKIRTDRDGVYSYGFKYRLNDGIETISDSVSGKTSSIFLWITSGDIILVIYFFILGFFTYDQDWNKAVGILGYAMSLALLAYTLFIPILGIVVAFCQVFFLNPLMLSFFELESTPLTNTILIAFFAFVYGLNITLTLLLSNYLRKWRIKRRDGEKKELLSKDEREFVNVLVVSCLIALLVTITTIIVFWLFGYI
jgi:predicted PurR-regulated permease PerM